MPTTFVNQKATPEHPLDKSKVSSKKVSEIYSEEENQYLNFLQIRLERAKEMKDQVYPEFGGTTYYEYFDKNENIANTFLPKSKNSDDVIVSSGTVEQKLDALLANINNLNLSPELLAFDHEHRRHMALGKAIEDVIFITEVNDGGDGGGDEEKKISRQRELLKQGTVFVMEEWVKKWQMKKRLKDSKWNGQFRLEDGWEENLEKVFDGPKRSLLYGPNVFLGDITKFYMEDQPFVFVVIYQDYDIAKERYGKFDNWKYVQRGGVKIQNDLSKTIYENNWRLGKLEDNQVEIILYQDPHRDEFQIIINGVLMMPIGFPLSAVSPGGGYNIAKQVFRMVNEKFAYGSSFVQSGSVQKISEVIDEMLKLFILKFRKSVTPAYVNKSGKVIPRKVLSPGRISMGFQASDLEVISTSETQGITSGEVAIYREMQDLVERSTISNTFSGQESNRQMTATQVLELQKQSRLMLGLAITSTALLEKKLAYLRLYNIIANWFEPIGEKVDELGEVRRIVKMFRRTSRQVNIDGEGLGERSVVPLDGELPSEEEVRALEIKQGREKGLPVRKIYLSPKKLKSLKVIWYFEINPKEKESSALNKLMFREMLNDILSLMNVGSRPNREGLEEALSQAWNRPTNKMFSAPVSDSINSVESELDSQFGGSLARNSLNGLGSSQRNTGNEAGRPQLPTATAENT